MNADLFYFLQELFRDPHNFLQLWPSSWGRSHERQWSSVIAFCLTWPQGSLLPFYSLSADNLQWSGCCYVKLIVHKTQNCHPFTIHVSLAGQCKNIHCHQWIKYVISLQTFSQVCWARKSWLFTTVLNLPAFAVHCLSPLSLWPCFLSLYLPGNYLIAAAIIYVPLCSSQHSRALVIGRLFQWIE